MFQLRPVLRPKTGSGQSTFYIFSLAPARLRPSSGQWPEYRQPPTFSGQIAHYMENILSPYLCAYRKGYNTQHALLRLIEKCRSFLDRKGLAGAILMDLSKAFDCLNHELLIAKLEAYGFSRSALKLVYDYLSNRKQRVKIYEYCYQFTMCHCYQFIMCNQSNAERGFWRS